MKFAYLGAFLMSVMSACGGKSSSQAGDGGNGSGGNGGAPGTGGAGGASRYFITGEVDGVTMRGETNVRARWYQGLLEGFLGLSAEIGNGWSWELTIRNETGNPSCGIAAVILNQSGPEMVSFGTFDTRTSCTFEVSAAAPNVGDVIEGMFTATLSALPTTSPDRVVTGGAFRVVRVEPGF
jgi:hypothetical protein